MELWFCYWVSIFAKSVPYRNSGDKAALTHCAGGSESEALGALQACAQPILSELRPQSWESENDLFSVC